MNIDENVVESIVKRVVSQLSTETASAQTCPSGGDWGVFESMNDAVDAAVEAQREYLNRSMHDRACYVQAIRDVVLDQENLEYISRLAVEETGMGGYEYKLIKNRLAAVKTPGIEDLTTDAMSGDDGLTLVEYSPFGVIGSNAHDALRHHAACEADGLALELVKMLVDVAGIVIALEANLLERVVARGLQLSQLLASDALELVQLLCGLLVLLLRLMLFCHSFPIFLYHLSAFLRKRACKRNFSALTFRS